jgi:hypothetical protein
MKAVDISTIRGNYSGPLTGASTTWENAARNVGNSTRRFLSG